MWDDRSRARPLRIGSPVTPVRRPLPCRLSPGEVFAALSDEPMPFALAGSWSGGGAIVSSDPVVVAGDEDDPFEVLDELPVVASGPADRETAIGGGWFGWLSYRLAARVEQVPPGPPRPVAMPEFHLAYYDNLVRQDTGGDWWFEALVSDARAADLGRRERHLSDLLSRAPIRGAAAPGDIGPLALEAGAAAAHLDAIASCRERIAAGEIFQANLCVRLEAANTASAAALFDRGIRSGCPPFAATFTTPRGSIVSFSPELFLRRDGDHVMTAPIKGTAPRGANKLADDAARARLLKSAKDACEHVMIVDLMRNDLGRVSAYGSIQAASTPTAQAHPGLWHLSRRSRESYGRGPATPTCCAPPSRPDRSPERPRSKH